MEKFVVAVTGDFLNEAGELAYGHTMIERLAGVPFVTIDFLRDQAPHPGEAHYLSRAYAMHVTADQIAGADGLIVLRPWVPSTAFDRGADRLVVLGRSGAGYDKVDLAACTAHDVAVFNVPHALNHSTASTALLFMLALAKRLKEQERIARAGRWDLQAAVMGHELEGRTLGIIGLGFSGRTLARLVAPFQMQLLAYSPHADPAVAHSLGVRLTSLDELLSLSDFVSIHARLTAQSRRLITAAGLARMKPTAYLINVARGEIVDQSALAAALREKRIAGAALDVFEVEPLPTDDPLLDLENVIVTPHWSASTSDVWKATGEALARGMLRAARGEPPENVVNPEVLDRSGFRNKLARFADNRAGPR